MASSLSAQEFALGPTTASHAEVELVAEVDSVEPGQIFDVALRMEMEPHWHIYWLNPGDTGMAPTVQWGLPEGFEIAELRFPYPQLIPTPPLVSYGYEGEVYLLASVSAPADLEPGQTLRFTAQADWLICSDVCIPGDAALAMELMSVGDGESGQSDRSEAFEATRATIPAVVQGASASYEILDDAVVAILTWPGFAGQELEDAHFFFEQEAISDSAAEQLFELSGTTLRIAVPKSDYFDHDIESYTGVLYSANGFAAAEGAKAIRFEEGGAAAAASGSEPSVPVPSLGLGQALLYAFLGGLILNLMPCVFPVLSIKALGFAQQSGEDRRKVLRHGLVFSAGVVVSFWILAGVLIALRSAGESLGWGFQLQQPEFVAALLLVMFLFGLSLAGVFEFGTSAISLAGKVKSEGYAGSFFFGVVATAVATPCTGPFMGPALGFALTLSAVEALSVFTFLALGMAAPYLILSANPALINKLPRPGAWMETFKQAMAFPMFATCIWLIWVLGSQVGNDALVWVLGGLLVAAIGAWVYGRWAVPHRKTSTRRIAIGFAAALTLAGLWLMMPPAVVEGESAEVAWQEYSPQLVEQLRAEGKPIFVDFTADWCLTCKANERIVFSSAEVRERFAEMGVAMVQGDWTRRNPEITQALESFGRSGVPLYLLYDGRPDSEPQVLPQLLSPARVLDALDEIAVASR